MFFIYILYTFLLLEFAPLALYYIRHAQAYTHCISTERYGSQTTFTPGTHRSYMTGTVIDSGIGHQRSRHTDPDTDRESYLQRLIYKRAQQLKDGGESLKDRLERYVQLRTAQHWTPTHPSYYLFDARRKSFDTWTRKEGVPSPESLAEAGFFFFEVHI